MQPFLLPVTAYFELKTILSQVRQNSIQIMWNYLSDNNVEIIKAVLAAGTKK
jgi:hypothetical protein